MYLRGILLYDLLAVGSCFLLALVVRKRSAAFPEREDKSKKKGGKAGSR